MNFKILNFCDSFCFKWQNYSFYNLMIFQFSRNKNQIDSLKVNLSEPFFLFVFLRFRSFTVMSVNRWLNYKYYYFTVCQRIRWFQTVSLSSTLRLYRSNLVIEPSSRYQIKLQFCTLTSMQCGNNYQIWISFYINSSLGKE